MIINPYRFLWTPEQATTQAWWDAADTDTISDTGGLTDSITDKSGNSLTLSALSTKRPTTNSVTMNSLNTLLFQGAANEMNTASNPFGASISNAAIFMVIKTPSLLVKGTNFTLTGSATNAYRWQAHAPWVSTVYFDCGAVATPNRISSGSWVTTSEEIFCSFYCSTTDSVQQIWKNGTQTVADASGHTVSTVGNIFIGSANGSQYQNFQLGECIIINGTVTTTLRQMIEGYLAWKWGMQAKLPSGHPYEYEPPLG